MLTGQRWFLRRRHDFKPLNEYEATPNSSSKTQQYNSEIASVLES